MNNKKSKLGKIFKSKFVKSLLLRAVSIFTVISIAVVLIVLIAFSSEITEGTLAESEKQLGVISDTITRRMSETTDIALSIADDSTFSILASGNADESSEITSALRRYLIGNEFINYLAFYRASEPTRIYTSQGEYSYEVFWNTYLHFEEVTKEEHLNNITKQVGAGIISLRKGASESYFTYVLTLPTFSKSPKAYVIAYIPLSIINPLLRSQFLNGHGSVAIFDSNNENIYTLSTLPSNVALSVSDFGDETEKTLIIDGERYIFQKHEAEKPNWTFISAIRKSDVITGVAQRELILVILLLSVLAIAVIAIFFMIIVQYKPIRKLADEVASGNDQEDTSDDDISVLSDRLAVLKGDSEQKQKFENAYLVAESANKAKSAFLSNMSHDIRTPMNAIIGMTDIAVKNLDKPEYVGECLQKVQVASQYLLDIINNVLDMSRIESGRFSLSAETINLPKLVYSLKTLLHPSMEERRQKLIFKIDNIVNESFVGDNVRLTQIFVNILSNSIKFTQNGGMITLGMEQTASTADGYGDYVFTFTDNGIGMPAEFVEKVFDTFSRANDAATGKIEGTGLGMAIVKNLVELMGGTIECKSEKDKGTTFLVKLHMKLAETDRDEKTIDFLSRYEGEKVLILCDNEEDIENQADILSEYNMTSLRVVSVEEAVVAIADSEKAGSPYKAVLINGADDEEYCLTSLKALSSAVGNKQPVFVLVARDVSEVNLSSAKEVADCTLIQAPLFKSTLAEAFDEEYGIKNEKKIVEERLDLTGKKVLLVEDNAINREIACNMVRETTAEIFEAENGAEAVEAYENHPEGYFDIILMDLQMPVMNGYEATKTIRQMGRSDSESIPIYAMTANTFDEDVRQVKEVGMNGHIAKPYNIADLYRALGSALNRKNY